MKRLFILVLSLILLVGCGGGGGGGGNPVGPSTTDTVVVAPTPTPTVSATPTPTPTPTVTPTVFTPTSELAATADVGAVTLAVPLQSQMVLSLSSVNSCGPTSEAMAIAYYTGATDVKSLAEKLWTDSGADEAKGALVSDLITAAQKNGFPEAKTYFDKDVAWVKAQIDLGKPVLIHGPAHMVVAVGYEPDGDVLYNDPAYGTRYRKTAANFMEWWKGGGPSAILLK